MQDTKDMTPIEIALGVDEHGCTTAKKLYAFLGLNPGHYSRWCKSKITENDSVTENVDYWVSTPPAIDGERNENGKFTSGQSKDYKLSASFAKKLAMKTNNDRGEEVRQYLSGISHNPEVFTVEGDVQEALLTLPTNNVSIIADLARNPIEYNGEKVITTKLLAQIYETDERTIRDSFYRNQNRFIEGKHYFRLEGDELAVFKDSNVNSVVVGRTANELILWTHKGASRHCKPLGTDKAWEQFDMLEEGYFFLKEAIKTGVIDTEQFQAQMLLTQLEREKLLTQEAQARAKLAEELLQIEQQSRESKVEAERLLSESKVETERQLRESKVETERQLCESKVKTEHQLRETERLLIEAKIETERQFRETERKLGDTKIMGNCAHTIWNDPTLSQEQRQQISLNLYKQHGIPVTSAEKSNALTGISYEFDDNHVWKAWYIPTVIAKILHMAYSTSSGGPQARAISIIASYLNPRKGIDYKEYQVDIPYAQPNGTLIYRVGDPGCRFSGEFCNRIKSWLIDHQAKYGYYPTTIKCDQNKNHYIRYLDINALYNAYFQF